MKEYTVNSIKLHHYFSFSVEQGHTFIQDLNTSFLISVF